MMKLNGLCLSHVFALILLVFPNYVFGQQVQRFLHQSGKHFWTAHPEKEDLKGYISEGCQFYSGGEIPVYRFLHQSGKHFWTAYPEKEDLRGYTREGIGFYSSDDGDPIYRFYNENSDKHLWTPYPEREDLTGYTAEGVVFLARLCKSSEAKNVRYKKRNDCYDITANLTDLVDANLEICDKSATVKIRVAGFKIQEYKVKRDGKKNRYVFERKFNYMGIRIYYYPDKGLVTWKKMWQDIKAPYNWHRDKHARHLIQF